jgi:mycothiol synthase
MLRTDWIPACTWTMTANNITTRPYEGEADYQRIRDLLVESFALSAQPNYGTIGDLDWWRFTDDDPDALHAAQLWIDNERILALAWPNGSQADLFIHPHHEDLTVAAIEWLEERQRQTQDNAHRTLSVPCYDGDAVRRAALETRGYVRHDSSLHYWFRRFDGREPAPALPDGYVIRPFRGAVELKARVEVHRQAFAPSRMTAAKHRAVMQAPTYHQELDLVALAPDGSLAAYCIVWHDPANRHGVFEPVGCHPAHRRRGLARAVLHAGFRSLLHLGSVSACVMSAGGAPAATRLYQSAGFDIVDTMHHWKRPA